MNKYRLFIPSTEHTLDKHLNNNDNFIIVTVPVIQYIKNKHICNFDGILFIDTLKNEYLIREDILYLDIPKYGIQRFNKKQQTSILDKYDIYHPDTYFINSNICENTISSLMIDIKDDEKIVVKYILGARGLGQVLCTKKEFIKIVSAQNLNDIFKDNTYDQINTGYEQSSSINTIKPKTGLENIKYNYFYDLTRLNSNNRDFMVQKYVENRDEYRLLWFYGEDPIIVKRNIDKGNWQANACNNSKSSSIRTSGNIDDVIYNKIDKMCSDLKVPFMSIDVFYDNFEKKYGVLEFQTEFGWTNTEGIDSRELNIKINQSINNLILKKNGN